MYRLGIAIRTPSTTFETLNAEASLLPTWGLHISNHTFPVRTWHDLGCHGMHGTCVVFSNIAFICQFQCLHMLFFHHRVYMCCVSFLLMQLLCRYDWLLCGHAAKACWDLQLYTQNGPSDTNCSQAVLVLASDAKPGIARFGCWVRFGMASRLVDNAAGSHSDLAIFID